MNRQERLLRGNAEILLRRALSGLFLCSLLLASWLMHVLQRTF